MHPVFNYIELYFIDFDNSKLCINFASLHIKMDTESKFKVNVTMIQSGTQRLNLVKIIKDCTGMGLKDCISQISNPTFEIWVDDPISFKRRINEETDFEFMVEDKTKQRQKKIISLGLGDKDDKIEIISDHLTMRMMNLINSNASFGAPKNSLYTNLSGFFDEFLSKLDDSQIDKLLNTDNDIS